jgi:hypothetical protein
VLPREGGETISLLPELPNKGNDDRSPDISFAYDLVGSSLT